jgi:hypothetical protein
VNPEIGKGMMILGGLLLVLGLVVHNAGSSLDWIGRLPGDIRVERDNFSFYFPITTLILLSLILTLGVRLFQWILSLFS